MNSILQSTSNYLARKFGVRAAMPGFIGKKLCADLVLVPPNFEKYTTVSKQIRSVLADYDSNYCPMSLDEAYLDITDNLQQRIKTSDIQRTFLCGDTNLKNSLDFKLCLCDLNDTIRNRVIETLSTNGRDVFHEMKEIIVLSTGVRVSCLNSKNMNFIENEVCCTCNKMIPNFDLLTFDLTPEGTLQEMRMRIEQKTRLTASAGN